MNTKTLLAASLAAMSVTAFSQVQGFDRNFQRLDKVPHYKGTDSHSAPTTSSKGVLGFTQPDTNRSYMGSWEYLSRPMGASSDYKSLMASLTYTRFDPTGGGAKSDGYSFTGEYQFGKDANYALTVGAFLGYFSAAAAKVYAPYIDGTYAITNELFLTPTVTWARVNAGGGNTDSTVPDFQVMYAPNTMKNVVVSGDYFVRTKNNFAAAMFNGKYDFNQKWGFRAGVLASKVFNPSYAFEVTYRF